MTRSRRSRRAFLAGSGAVALAAVAGCTGPLTTASETRTLSALDGATPVAVDTHNGDVTVTGEDRADGHLSLTKRTRRNVDLDRVTVAVTTRDGVATLEPDVPDDVPRGAVSLDVDLAVPRGTPVERVETVNGDVRVTDVGGDLSVATRNGEVTVADLDGTVAVRTTNGDVEVERVAAIGAIHTVNGDVDAAVSSMPGDTRIETTNGGVTLALADGLDARVDVALVNGEVTTGDLALGAASPGRTRVAGALGSGGPTLTVRTVNGDVTLGRQSG